VSQCVALQLQYVAVCCSVLQYVALCFSVLHCVSLCCIVLQCVAVCGSVFQCVAACRGVLQCVAVCCSVLHGVAVCFYLAFADVILRVVDLEQPQKFLKVSFVFFCFIVNLWVTSLLLRILMIFHISEPRCSAPISRHFEKSAWN